MKKKKKDEEEKEEEEKKEPTIQEILSTLPIKISFMGSLFSGKKTQAKLLTDKFEHLKSYYIPDIIKELKEIKLKSEEKIEDNPKFKSMKKNQIEQFEKEKEELKEKLKDFIPLLEQLPEDENEKINDETIVDLFILKLKLDFQLRDLEEVKKSIEENKETINQLNELINSIKEEQISKPKNKQKELEKAIQDLEKIYNDSYYGFITINFPENLQQARILEFKINNYSQPIEGNKTEVDILKEKIMYAFDKEIKENKSTLQESTINYFFDFEIEQDKIFERVDNRKLDPQTGIIYHMTFNPPNEKDKKLMARLVDVNDPTHEQIEESQSKLLQNYDKIKQFYLNFITKHIDIQSDLSQDEIYNIISDKIKLIVNEFEEKLINKNIQNEQSEKEIERKDSIQNEIISKDQTGSNNSELNSPSEQKQIEFNKRISFNLNKNVIKASPVLKTSLIDVLFGYNKISKMLDVYSFYLQKIFHKKKTISNPIGDVLMNYQNEFIQFLSRPSKKREVIKKFTNKIEAFYKEFKPINQHNLVLEEFNKDIIEITKQIWEIINQRKNESIEELQRITSTTFFDDEMEKFYFNIERMFILETEKFISILEVLNLFYYNTKENKFTIGEKVCNEILKNTEEIEKAKEDEKGRINYPKLERIYKNCYIIIIKLYIYMKKAKKNGFKSNQIQSSLTVHRKKKKLSPNENQISINKNAIDSDINLEKSIKIEITKYKYKINFLFEYGYYKLGTIYAASRNIFKEMDKWIIKSIEYQNDAMNRTIKSLKDSVMKGKYNDYIKYIELDDFSEQYQIIEYNDILQGKTKKKDGEEEEKKEDKISENAFSVYYLNLVFTKIKNAELQRGIITKENFIEIFFKQFLLDPIKKKNFSITFQKFDFHNIMHFLTYFNFTSKDIRLDDENNDEGEPFDLILSNEILTIILLSHFQVPSEEIAQNIKNDNIDKIEKGLFMKKNDFINLKFWFEDDENYYKDINTIFDNEKIDGYDKGKKIKEILFDLNKLDDEQINIDVFIDIITLKGITKNKNPKSVESISKYIEMFFP
jgi:adenylate kinase family enzyme